jgi:hypothetical protein
MAAGRTGRSLMSQKEKQEFQTARRFAFETGMETSKRKDAET